MNHQSIVDRLFSSLPHEIQFCFLRLLERELEDEVGLELFVEVEQNDLLNASLWELYTSLPPKARDVARQISIPHSPPIDQKHYHWLGIEQLIKAGWIILDENNQYDMPQIFKDYAHEQVLRWGL